MQALRRWSVRQAAALARMYRGAARLAPRLAPLVGPLGPQGLASLLRPAERAAKSALFDCRMCGQCVLSSTGMACPMNCGKQLRNGPCGGVRADGGCEVDPTMRCVWLEAGEGDVRTGSGAHTAGWFERLPPLDRRRQGRSTWAPVILPPPTLKAKPVADGPGPSPFPEQPAPGPFETACRSGRFVVTVEIAPPDSADPQALLARARRFRDLADAINITDGAGANCHMSSVAAASILAADGLPAVCQVGCRDRNRIAVQGDVLGAAALGVRNVLCLTGDDVSQGDHPEAKPVFDLDAVNLLHIVRGMRDRGEYASGRRLEKPPALFLGATANPFMPPYADRVANLQRKVDAGAQFIQTQFCFDLKLIEDFMREVRARELHKRAFILVGVGTLSSAKALRWMAEHVPGVHVPHAVTDRIAAAADPKAEGIRIAVETIHALAQIEGVAGVHLMGHRNEAALAQIVVDAGLREPAALRA